MSQDYCSKIKDKRIITMQNGAVTCVHFVDGIYDCMHILHFKIESLKDICVKHYIKRYTEDNKTELTDIPNWQRLCNSKHYPELCFAMLLCEESLMDNDSS